MKMVEVFSRVGSRFFGALKPRYEDKVPGIRGDVFLTLRDGKTGVVQDKREVRNIIVRDASILVARLMKDNAEPPKGIYVLAIGTGDIGWNPLAPPAPTTTQRSLYSELTRKTFSTTQFVDAAGVPTAIPTPIVDFSTVYTESEAVGPLVEMGLIGGNISTNMSVRNPVLPPNGPYNPLEDLTTKETLVNYLTFPVISKPATSTLEITWRLSF